MSDNIGIFQASEVLSSLEVITEEYKEFCSHHNFSNNVETLELLTEYVKTHKVELNKFIDGQNA